MTTRRRRPVFADIVDEVKHEPPAPPGPGPMLFAPDGCGYRWVDELTPAGAMDLVAGGALVAWDSCGCLGGCGDLRWLDPAAGPRLIQAGPPILRTRKGTPGELSYWCAQNGQTLVLASYDVRWGRFMF